jgi:hypothetical protein
MVNTPVAPPRFDGESRKGFLVVETLERIQKLYSTYFGLFRIYRDRTLLSNFTILGGLP